MAGQAGGQLRVAGAARLRSTLRRAGADMKELSALNKAAAGIVAAAAGPMTPRGPEVGGHLAKTVRVGATQRAGIVRVGNARMPYAGKVHYGTPDGVVRPNTWVIDAAQATENQWVSLYEAGLVKIIGKIEGDTQ